jgi:TonB family protein
VADVHTQPVDLRLEVDAAGTPARYEVQRSSGFVPLDSAALLIAAHTRFEPARNGAVAVPLTITFPVSFAPRIPAEHRPQEFARGPSVLNGRELKQRLGRVCGGNSRLGETSVRLLVGADGAVKSMEFEQPSGWRGLDRVALEIVHHARFAPAATRNGTPVGSWLVYTFRCTS